MEGKRKRGAPGTCPWPRSAAPRVRRASRLRLRRRRRHQIRMPWRPAIKGKGREGRGREADSSGWDKGGTEDKGGLYKGREGGLE